MYILSQNGCALTEASLGGIFVTDNGCKLGQEVTDSVTLLGEFSSKENTKKALLLVAEALENGDTVYRIPTDEMVSVKHANSEGQKWA